MPMRLSSAARNSAARRQSSLCSGRVEMDGMRSRSFSSLRKRGWFCVAKSTADEDMSDGPFQRNRQERV